MATLTTRRPDAATLSPLRQTLAVAIGDKVRLEAELVVLRVQEDGLFDRKIAVNREVDDLVEQIRRACPQPVLLRRMTGLPPILGEAPEPPIELAMEHSAALSRLVAATEARNTLRDRIADLEQDLARKVEDIDNARRAVVAADPAVQALVQRAVDAQLAAWDATVALKWAAREKLVPEMAAKEAIERFVMAPHNWPGMHGVVAGDEPWVEAFEALMTDAAAPLPK